MGYSKYVGRVGALAIALGIGTAVANPAWASTGTDDSGNHPSGTSESAAAHPSGDNPSRNDGPGTASGGLGDTGETDQGRGGASDDSLDDESALHENLTVDENLTGDDETSADENLTGDDATSGDENLTGGEDTFGGEADPQAVVTTDPPVSAQGDAGGDAGDEGGLEPIPVAPEVLAAPVGGIDESASARSVPVDPPADPPADQAVTMGSEPAAAVELDPAPQALQALSLFGQDQATTYTAAHTLGSSTAAPGAPAPAPLVSQPRTPLGVIIGAPFAIIRIATQAIDMLLHPDPTAPTSQPLLLGVLAFVRREIQRTFFNSSPHAVADTATTSEAMPTTIAVLSNDTDPDQGDVLTVTHYTQPSNGTVVLNPDGTFTYTSAAGFHGTDSFTYTVSDAASPWHVHNLLDILFGGRHNSTTTVSLTIEAANTAPQPLDDFDVVDEDSGTTAIDVLANDGDGDGDTLTVVAVSTPDQGGSASINSDGTIAYTPAADFHGVEFFSYTVSDGTDQATATVTVTVAPVDDAPVANDDSGSASEDGSVTIDVLANDTDIDTSQLSVIAISAPAHGTAAINPEGTITYTPVADYHGTDTFSYTVTDGSSEDIATVTVTVTPVNDAPIASVITGQPDAITGVVQGSTIATDIDGDTLDYSAAPLKTEYGTVNIDPNTGAFTYTPDNPVPVSPNSGFWTGSLDEWSTGTVNTDQGPVLVAPDNPGTGVSVITGSLSFDAPPWPDTNTPAASWVHTPANTAAALSPNDTQTFAEAGTALGLSAEQQQEIIVISAETPTDAAWMARIVHLEADTVYTMVWNYIGTDYEPFNDGSITTLVYQGDGPAPTVLVNNHADNFAILGFTNLGTGDYSTGSYGSTGWQTATYQVSQEGDYLLGFAIFNMRDDAYDPVLLVASQPGTTLRDGVPFGPVPPNNPNAPQTVLDTFTVTVDDGNGGTTDVEVTVPVTILVDAQPVANDDELSTDEDTTLVIAPADLLSNDVGDDLVVTVVDTPTHGTLTANQDGTFSYTPVADYSGIDTFTYTAANAVTSNTATVTISIDPVNDAPVAVADAFGTDEDVAVDIDPNTLLANDTDVESDTLTITAVGNPVHGSAALNPNGTITYTPAPDFFGTDEFTYTVTDGELTDTATVTVTVAEVDDAPIAGADALSTEEDTTLLIDPSTLLANDIGEDLSVVIVDAPAHGTLNANPDGTFSYTPGENYFGTDTFTYAAVNTATSNTATVTITINPVNDDPTLDPAAPTTNAATGEVIGSLGAEDVDGDPLTFSASDPTLGSVTITNGVFTYVPTAEARAAVSQGGPAIDTFTVTVSDGNGGTASQTITVAIAPDIDNITIELRWGAAPTDLDSHLTGPTVGLDGRFHVFYASRNYYDNDGSLAANLAADDVTSYGPELTTIYDRTPGSYLFYVYNYSGESPLDSSEATVTVRDTLSGLDQTYAISADATGRYWSVFQLTIDANGVATLTEINQYSESVPADPVDTGEAL